MRSLSVMPFPRKVTVVERRLGREGALGQCWEGLSIVEIDPRQDERERLDTLIHELFHIMLPEWGEERVLKHTGWLSKQIWDQGYRRVAMSPKRKRGDLPS